MFIGARGDKYWYISKKAVIHFLENRSRAFIGAYIDICIALLPRTAPSKMALKINNRVVVYKSKLLGEFKGVVLFVLLLTPNAGKGGKGAVYEGRYDNDIVAVKEIFKHGHAGEDEEGKQHKLLQRERHRNVVGYHCLEETEHFRYIVLELCQGSLDAGTIRGLTGEIGAKELLCQIADGVGHLHSLGILHRDLKPSNILISLPDTYGKRRLVISDFGTSRSERWTMTADTVPGTSTWRAPEVLNPNSQRRVGPATDIFSMGCIYYFILTCGGHPFRADESQAHTLVEANILERRSDLSRLIEWVDGNNQGSLNDDGNIVERKERWDWSGYEAGDLVATMIDNEPGKR